MQPQRQDTSAQQCHQAIRASIEQLGQQLQSGQSESFKTYLALLGRLHRYSWGNLLLISQQCPTATHVAGYRAWIKLGRQVRKGEHGIRILAPLMIAKSSSAASHDDKANDHDDQDRIRGYRSVCVFDISQTDGKSLPALPAVRGDVTRWLPRLIAWLQARSIDVVYDHLPPGMYGRSCGGRIILAADQTAAATFATLVHEAAHELLHHTPPEVVAVDTMNSVPGADHSHHTLSKTVVETEAEAVAYAVCSGLGLDVGTTSSDYIQLYRGTTQTLMDSVQRIADMASALLAAVHTSPPETRSVGQAAPAASASIVG